MSQTNPFIRGYSTLSIERVLQITHEGDCQPCHRALHPSQAHLPDETLRGFSCVFDDELALITQNQSTDDTLLDQYPSAGIVNNVLYSIYSDEYGQSHLIGDQYSLAAAQHIMRRLSFLTGHYSRCWEITSAHLSEKALDEIHWLASLDTSRRLSGLLVEFFHLPRYQGVCCKLISTPWTDQNLQSHGITSTRLRQEQLNRGLPTEVIELLHLAAQADVRFLIFDPDAAPLEGLPLSTPET
ncbi:ABC transporter substrate-binding protein [Pseudomonas yamanorum]|nr:ABC transporter substrate-binding protein [Pseudomonas yamanorum]